MTASDVKLDTGGLSRMILEQSSARTGPSCFSKIPMYFNILVVYRGNYGASVATAFSARRQDLPSAACKTGSADCFAGIRPILKSSLQPFRQAEVGPATLQGILTARLFDYSPSGVLIAKRPMPPRSHR